jgi:hypothetical protein
MKIVLEVLALALACDLVRAWVNPWKACRCAGRGCMRCRWNGKRLRFGARWVRPAIWKEYRNGL